MNAPALLLRRRALGVGAALILAGACGETGPSEQQPPASIANITGVALSGVAGQALQDLVAVRVLDAAQNPLEGITVTFAVSTGGGSVAPASAVTNSAGEARTRWTLGRTAGANTLSVSAGGTTTQITAAGVAGRPGEITISAGNNQSGGVGLPLTVSPSVLVRDANGNPVDGASVFFTVLTGGGRVATPASRTNAQGIAGAGIWTLGPSAGVQTIAAQVSEAGVTGNPVVFQATAAAGAASSVAAVSPVTQSAPVGGLVTRPPSVIVRDALGNGVPNVSVTFAVASGGGQLTGATQVTDAQGVATATSWRLGSVAGANSVTASVAGLTPVTFQATGQAGAPFGLLIVTGDGQSAPLGRPVADAPQVRVVDATGNGVPGVTVTFTVGLGGGVAIVNRPVSGADGTASVGAWLLGPTPGVNTLIASAPGLSPVTFTATATAGPPVSMQAVSLPTQTGTVGLPVASVPSVIVRDAQGNPVADVPVTFTVTSGGGTLTGPLQLTGSDGVATVGSWTLGLVAGTNTVDATSPGLPTVTFTATTVGIPAAVVAFAGDLQAAVQGTAVPIDPAVRVTDANGAAVPGVLVTFSVLNGGGSVTGGSVVTNSNGVAAVGSWVLGAGATQQLSAAVSASGVTGNPVTFTASAATKIAVTQQPPANAGTGVNFTVEVELQNAASLPSLVTGKALTISIASGGGTLNPGTTALTVNTTTGVATFNVNITGAAGARTLQIAGSGLTSVVTTTINVP